LSEANEAKVPSPLASLNVSSPTFTYDAIQLAHEAMAKAAQLRIEAQHLIAERKGLLGKLKKRGRP
jgi:hypothetical protein